MKPVCDGKKSQSTKFYRNAVCSDKKCQDTHMQPVKPAMKTSHMQSVTRSNNMRPIGPEMLQSTNKQHNYKVCSVRTASDDNKCQSTRLYKKSMSSDKNCPDTKFKWPVKSAMDMRSRKPEMQSSFNKKHVPLCSDKNCHSTRCYTKKDQAKSVCSDKYCQEA